MGRGEAQGFAELLDERARERAGFSALGVVDGPSLTCGAWADRSRVVARELRHRGVDVGDRVVLWFANSRWTDYAVAFAAVCRCGAVAVPVATRTSGLDLGRILADCGASAVVHHGTHRPPGEVSAPAWAVDDLEHRNDCVAEQVAEPAHGDPPGAAEVTYVTRPMRRPRALVHDVDDVPVALAASMRGSAGLLHAFPVGSLAAREALWLSLGVGQRPVLTVPGFEPERWCALTAAQEITAWGFLPAMARWLLESGAAERHDLSSVAHVALPGYGLSPSLLPDLAAVLPTATVVSLALTTWSERETGPAVRRPADRAAPSPLGPTVPREQIEQVTAATFERVLRRDGVRVSDDFFELGGDQMAATGVLSLVADAFEVEVPLAAFIAAPTVSGLASAVLARIGRSHEVRTAAAPVAFSQEGMLWQEQLAPGCQNLPPLVRRYEGPIDVAALEGALAEIIRRHEPLRTTFGLEDGRLLQAVAAEAARSLPVRDLTDLDADEQRRELGRFLSEAARPFDLVGGPLFEPTLFRMAPDDHVLVIRAHHTVYDDWSVSVFRRELSALYPSRITGEATGLDEPAAAFTDFARAQRRRLAGPAGAREVSWWRTQLAGAPLSVELPIDDPDLPPGAPQASPEPVTLQLTTDLVERLRALARRERATLFMTVLAAFQVLVRRYTGQDDLVMATVVAGRNRPELEDLIGCFTKKVLLRLRAPGDPTFAELVGKAREALLGSLSHQDLPFEAVLQEALGPEAAAHGLVPTVGIMFQGVTPQEDVVLPGLSTTGLDTSSRARRAHFASASPGEVAEVAAPPWGAGLYLGTFLILSLVDEGGGISLVARGAFHRPAVERLLEEFRALLVDVAAEPTRRVSEMAVVDVDGERRDVEAGVASECSALALFEAQAARNPSRVAVTGAFGRLTYEQLDVAAGALCRRLRAQGVGPGTVVGICLPPSVDCVIAVFAVWKAGGAYAGLDPDGSDNDIAAMTDAAQVDVVVAPPGPCREELRRRATVVNIGEEEDDGSPAHSAAAGRLGPDSVAVVLLQPAFSDNAGPVPLEQRSVVRLMTGLRSGVPSWRAVHEGGGTSPLRVCLSAAPSDDAFLRQVAALLDGQVLHVAASDTPEEIVELLRDGNVDLVDCSPEEAGGLLASGLQDAVRCRTDGAPAASLVVGWRNSVPRELWAQLAAVEGANVLQLYGPPLCGLATTLGRCPTAAQARLVGSPVPGVTARVLDRSGRPVPPGAVGELHASRPGTADLHGTHRLARRLPDGRIEILAAVKDAIDLRGFRIDRSELEAVLLASPGVSAAAVQVVERPPGGQRLVACLVPEPGAVLNLPQLRADLWSQLPGYAWPAAVVLASELPLLEDGQTDHGSLPPPDDGGWRSEGLDHSPLPEERLLAGLWADGVGVDWVEGSENYWQRFSFFDALAEASEAGLPVGNRHVSRTRTITALAAALAAERLQASRARTPEGLRPLRGPAGARTGGVRGWPARR